MRHFAKAALASLSIILNAGALAATTVSLQPATGHPNLAVTLTGSGFGVSEAVDIYIDTVDTLLAVSSATGALSVPITIPAAAQPGFHYVTGISRKSGSAAQAKFNVSTSWIESGFGAAHLAWNPYENTLNPSAVLSLEQLWATPVGGDAYGSPAVVAGKVYIASANGGGLYSLNATTGAVIWHQTTAPVDNFFSSAAVAKNVIYILGNSGHLYAFNALNGTLMWTKALAIPGLASPVVVNGVIYVASGPSLYALDASGNLIWGETLGTSGANLTGSAAVVNGRLYIGSVDGNLYVINASNGVLFYTRATGAISGAPAVANGVVYLASNDFKMYALRAQSGAVLWTQTAAASFVGSPAVAAGVVYGADINGDLYAFNAAKGTILWTDTIGQSISQASVADGVLYVGDDEWLRQRSRRQERPVSAGASDRGIRSTARRWW